MKKKEMWTPLIPTTRLPTLDEIKHYELGDPELLYRYAKDDDYLVGFVARFVKRNGEKDIRPLIQVRDEKGNDKWVYAGMPEPRPLYNEQLLKKYPKAKVILVEGEKAADELNKHLLADENCEPQFIAITWSGGANGWKKTDFSPLYERYIVFLPDNDIPGHECMYCIYLNIKANSSIHGYAIVPPPANSELGWDVADALLKENKTSDEVLQYVLAGLITGDAIDRYFESKIGKVTDKTKTTSKSIQPIPPVEENIVSAADLEALNHIPDIPVAAKAENNESSFDATYKNSHFTILGYDRDTMFYWQKEACQLIALKASQHTVSNLLLLAPETYWRELTEIDSAYQNAALNILIQRARRCGIFVPDRIRKAGVWRDGNNIVVHLGNRLMVNGKITNISDFSSTYIYEAAAAIDIGIEDVEVLSDSEANKMLELYLDEPFLSELDAFVLGSYPVHGLLSGALDWRTINLLTSDHGAGKSTILERTVLKSLGAFCIVIAGSTTEAAIRQTCNNTALPIVFDEAEGEAVKSGIRMQEILHLARQSTTNSSASIVKGGQSGTPQSFRVQSSFLLAAILAPQHQQADVSRIATSELTKIQGQEERIRSLNARISKLFTEESCKRFRKRVLELAPTILANIATLKIAVVAATGNHRKGDLYGTILGGAYAYKSSALITPEQANDWVQELGFTSEVSEASEPEAHRLLATLFETVRDVRNSLTVERVTIGELVIRCISNQSLSYDETALHQCGLTITRPKKPQSVSASEEAIERVLGSNQAMQFCIANSNVELKKILEKTSWPVNWNNALKRLPGAVEKTARMGHSTPRCVAIPVDYLKTHFFKEC